MTDRTEEASREDRAIEQALSRVMATANEPRLLPGRDGADAALVREYTELLGLLPYDLESEAPPSRIKERILERAAGAREAARRGEVGSSSSGSPVASFRPPSPRRYPARGNLALAAAFAACLVGMGLLGGQVWKQGRQIDQMRGERAVEVAAYDSTLSDLRSDLRTQKGRVEMVTTIARKAYPMRRVAQAAVGVGEPEGVVYVCGRHQQWYLSLHGLEPPAEGEAYRLWFQTGQGKIDGGILDVRPDSSTEMEALSMPPGTRGFEVALEKRGPEAGPESLTILLGDTAINL